MKPAAQNLYQQLAQRLYMQLAEAIAIMAKNGTLTASTRHGDNATEMVAKGYLYDFKLAPAIGGKPEVWVWLAGRWGRLEETRHSMEILAYNADLLLAKAKGDTANEPASRSAI